MKIFNSKEIKAWDQFTIEHEPISSLDLMERAADKCLAWIGTNQLLSHPFTIFCGKGNNGGDGLAIARMLTALSSKVTVYILESGQKGTDDFQANLQRLHQTATDIRYIQTEENFHSTGQQTIVIDALFGTGLSRSPETLVSNLIKHINQSGCRILSIDLPSGLFTDQSSKGNTVIKASDTLTFQCFKLALLLPENADSVGNIHRLDIGLEPAYYQSQPASWELSDSEMIHQLYRPRKSFAHKGNFGHALLVAGSYGKIGAALLAANACLRSGAGLLTCHIPNCGYTILQSGIPEAMVMTDFNSSFNTRIEADLAKFNAIGIGPGLGTAAETKAMLRDIIGAGSPPLVIDADGLNLISSTPQWLSLLPKNTIITPHPREFERLFGPSKNDFERVKLAIDKARQLEIIIVLKGHHTLIACPSGKAYFNNTGNAGMATGGSGDVLTGILTGLLAQEYPAVTAALLGVYLHGLAGDFAAKDLSMEGMLAGDITRYLGVAFQHL